jgi:hypothetical protein
MTDSAPQLALLCAAFWTAVLLYRGERPHWSRIMAGEVDAFFISRRARRGLRFAAIGMPIVAAWHVYWMTMELRGEGIGIPWALWAVVAISCGGAALLFAWGLRQVNRSIVEVSDQAIRWGLPTQICPVRRELPMEEVRSVDWKTPRHWKLLLRTRSAKSIAINVRGIEPSERDRVYDAIATRLAGSAG